ncbi:MAG: hypothetical protein CM1200mP37_3660 [Chloroflexota bacterium]|nr:MAG: hypothetical protein CM1200mP37_3660 [Chloroflexota bacterium]
MDVMSNYGIVPIKSMNDCLIAEKSGALSKLVCLIPVSLEIKGSIFLED